MFIDIDICPLAGLPHVSEIIQDDGTWLSGGAYIDLWSPFFIQIKMHLV